VAVLSDKDILRRVEKGELSIKPFDRSCINPAGYDARSARRVEIKPGVHVLLSTLEYFELPLDLVGFIYLRSSLAREGLIGSFAVIDPGFKGNLTLSVMNAGGGSVTIEEGERIVQVVFHQLSTPASKGYEGRYQGSIGVVPSKRKEKEVNA